jgi:hypothetical protein
MRSPQQIFKAFSGLSSQSNALTPQRKLASSLAGSSPRTFFIVCIGFADILAPLGKKTIHQSWDRRFAAIGALCEGTAKRSTGEIKRGTPVSGKSVVRL